MEALLIISLTLLIAAQAVATIRRARLFQKLERQNRIQEEFLRSVSHELRTPLNIVMGYAQMIRDGMLGETTADQDEALDKVVNRSRDLLALVTNMLLATSFGDDQLAVDRHEVNLGELLDYLRLDFLAALDKDLAMVWDYPPDLPVIKTDGAKLKQILQNLIGNAVKFTAKGKVTISAKVIEGARIEFKAADTGIGISKDELPFVFNKFRQVDSPATRPQGGAGLGLYIVKRYTELLGGELKVESAPGKGSVFTVTIPYEDGTAGRQRG